MNDYLNWRYTTKKFDLTKKIPKDELLIVLEALRLSPSSFGLQPWKFLVVKDENLRREIRKNAWNQEQVTDASHLIILCSLKKIDEEYIKNVVVQIAKSKGVPHQSLENYEQLIRGSVLSKTIYESSQWMKKQVYLALGMFLSACAQRGIDACPMEGFDPKKVDEILGLDAKGLESVVLCPIGYRSQDDRYSSLKKVRFERSEVFIEF